MAEPSQRVLLVGYYGVDNLGDEAIRHAIERAAATLDVDVAYYVSRGPDPDSRAIPSGIKGLPGLVRGILGVDRVVLGGGGILKDEGLRLPVELLVTTVLARVLGRRVTLLAVGVGPLYTRVGSLLVRTIARLAAVRTVRDAASAELLVTMGVRRVIVGADPIFTSEPEEQSGPGTGILPGADRGPVTRGAGSAPVALLSLRPWFHKLPAPEAASRTAALNAAVAATVRRLVDAGWQVQPVALYWPRDRAAFDDVAARAGPGCIESPQSATDWNGLVAAAWGASLVIAMRYHAVAAAAIAGSPVVALAYEPKVRSLARDLGVLAIDVDATDIEARLTEVADGVATGLLPPSCASDAVQGLRGRAWNAMRLALLA